MMTVKAELLNLVETVAEQVDLPPVDWVYIPEPDPGPGRHTEFGIVTLLDGFRRSLLRMAGRFTERHGQPL